MPDKFSMSSTDELLKKLKLVHTTSQIASPDVASLFSRALVKTIIETKINYAYNKDDLAPPLKHNKFKREHLMTCIIETSFRHPNGDLYK